MSELRRVTEGPYYIEDIRGAKLPVRLECETRGGKQYEYYPIGTYVVAAPGVCGGRATFKATRIDIANLLPELGGGKSGTEISAEFDGRIPPEAIEEARSLAVQNPPEVFERELVPRDLSH